MSVAELYYENTLNCDVKFHDLELHSDSMGYYLSATYIVEDESSVRELFIPKIRLSINRKSVGIKVDTTPFGDRKADIGFGWCDLSHTGTKESIYFIETVLEEKTHEITLDEIEKE